MKGREKREKMEGREGRITWRVCVCLCVCACALGMAFQTRVGERHGLGKRLEGCLRRGREGARAGRCESMGPGG